MLLDHGEAMAAAPGTRAARALDDLYRAHVAAVYRYAYAVLGNHADAEDVTQTTFVNALRALERGESPRKPENWLLVIAHNIVRQRFRQQQARPAEVELDRDVAVLVPVEDDSTPTLEELVRALQRIPPSQREALVMRELEGRSYRELAEILDLSTSALETLLFRARRSLADELENLATCEQAKLALSNRADGRLPRKELRRLNEHLAECRSCARLAERQRRYGRAFKGLAVLPLPLSLTLFKGPPSAAAATAVPAIGGGAAAATGGAVGAGAGGAAAGGFLAAAAAKVAAVTVTATVVAGVGYQAVARVQDEGGPSARTAPPAAAARATGTASSSGAARPAAAKAPGWRRAAAPSQEENAPGPPVASTARASTPPPRPKAATGHAGKPDDGNVRAPREPETPGAMNGPLGPSRADGAAGRGLVKEAKAKAKAKEKAKPMPTAGRPGPNRDAAARAPGPSPAKQPRVEAPATQPERTDQPPGKSEPKRNPVETGLPAVTPPAAAGIPPAPAVASDAPGLAAHPHANGKK